MELKELTKTEFAAIVARCRKMVRKERMLPGSIIGSCDGTLNESLGYFKQVLGSESSAKRCIRYLEENDVTCECEVFLNIIPKILQKK